MKVISTANTISQAFKNAGRVREILGVLASNGFKDLTQRMRLTRFLPKDQAENPQHSNLPIAARLRVSFEQLGPTFVKLGQLLATRSDLIPESWVEEFEKLQDQVPGVSSAEIRDLIQAELGKPIEAVFSQFDDVPLAAASIAQVHSAVLRSGESVAVKVQRPGIDKILQTDISILRGLAALLEKYVPEARPFNPSGLVDEFFQTMMYETDFRVEANNIRKIRTNLASLKQVTVPEVYLRYCSSKVLVMERFQGVRFSDREAILAKGIDPQKIIEYGADAFFHMVMRNGLFHGDLHAGNLFVLEDGRIGIIDFGIVGRLSAKVQDSIITMFMAIMDEDYESLASEYVNLCQSGGETDIILLQKDLMDTISPYVGMFLGDVNVGKLLLQSTAIAARHKLRVPRELMLLFRALVTIDGLGKRLDPTFDILQLGNRLAREIVTTRYSRERLTRDLIVLGRDLQDTLQTFPRLLKRFLRVWSQNNFAFETKSRDLPFINLAIRQATYCGMVAALAFVLAAIGIAFVIVDKGPTVFGTPLWPILCLPGSVILLALTAWKLRGQGKG